MSMKTIGSGINVFSPTFRDTIVIPVGEDDIPSGDEVREMIETQFPELDEERRAWMYDFEHQYTQPGDYLILLEGMQTTTVAVPLALYEKSGNFQSDQRSQDRLLRKAIKEASDSVQEDLHNPFNGNIRYINVSGIQSGKAAS